MTDPAAEKLAELTERLLMNTRDHRVDWDQTDQHNEFVATLMGASVSIYRSDGEHSTILVVRDDVGTELESRWVPDSTTMGADEAEARMSRVLPELHEMVRRRVLKVDETIDNLLGQLRPGGPIGRRGKPT